MKKIIILSYFFPPSNLTGGFRVFGWAKNLAKYNYYPVVITRNWNNQGSQEKERLQSSGEEVEIIKHQGYEVHYLPYKPSLRDKCLNRDLFFLSKVLTFFELVMRNMMLKAIPFYNLYSYTKKMLKKDNEIKHLLISANPYEQFYFGYQLKRHFPKLLWIADYRDEWTTNSEYNNARGKNFLIKFLERKSEFKWLQNSDLIITTCNYFADRISKKIKKNVKIVSHGFNNESISINKDNIYDKEKFSIVYGGSIYPDQPIEKFIQIWNLFAKNKSDVELLFLGANIDPVGKKRVRSDIYKSIRSTDRVSKEESEKTHLKAALLLLLPYQDMIGLPPSKLYHYLAYKRPILFYPSDNDIMEEVLSDTKLGVIPKDDHELLVTLEHYYDKWKNNQLFSINGVNLLKYSQDNQTRILADYLNNNYLG